MAKEKNKKEGWEDEELKDDDELEEEDEEQESKKKKAEDDDDSDDDEEEDTDDDDDDEFDDDDDDDFDDDDDDEDFDWDKEEEKKKNQNYMAAIIILAGLFIGSLFVDIVQLVRGEGISLRKLESVDVFSAGGKTWIASDDPIVEMTVINDEDCEQCQVEPIIDAVKKTALPSVVVKKVDANSSEGKLLLEEFGVKAVPVFAFDKNVQETDFWEQAEAVLEENGDMFVLDNAKAGIPNGKYIELPEFKSNVAISGNKDAELSVILFSDFQCPYSKSFGDTFAKVQTKYGDKMKVAFKQLPLQSIHPQAYNAALASMCANDQGKFWEMYKNLFDTQDTWGKAEGKDAFLTNARALGLNEADFKKCMDEDKHKGDIEADEQLAENFGLSGTPAVFIGEEFINGAVSEEVLTKAIEKELGINQDQEANDEEENKTENE